MRFVLESPSDDPAVVAVIKRHLEARKIQFVIEEDEQWVNAYGPVYRMEITSNRMDHEGTGPFYSVGIDVLHDDIGTRLSVCLMRMGERTDKALFQIVGELLETTLANISLTDA